MAGEPARFSVDVWDDRFYVQTDDGASRRRVLRVDPSSPGRGAWQEIVPEAPDAVFWRMSTATAGGGYAVPNLRGGAEYGEDWHRAGMLGRKQNVFDDFIAAAEYLVDEGWTEPERLAIKGGSNGGLLVGAALIQRPDLFRAVICSVPLLDMLRYHRFGSGRTWVSEYGSADRQEDFGWLSAYSPYHRVQTGVPYPAVLFTSSDSDDRVDPLHARKMTAALQAAGGGEPVLLRIEANAGHGGADLVRSAVAESVDQYAFLFERLGLRSPSP